METHHLDVEHRSLAGRLAQWLRDWSANRGPSTQLDALDEAETARIARDIGVGVSDLRAISAKGPHAADLLLQRMKRLGLDPAEIKHCEPEVMRDLQRLCTMCESQGRCARELARTSPSLDWDAYCPNADTLRALVLEHADNCSHGIAE